MSKLSMIYKTVLRGGVFSLALSAMMAAPLAMAHDHGNWPTRDIDFIIPFGAGGGSDAWARVISIGAREHFGVNWNLQNRPGAGATVGWEHLLNQPADGYTVYMGSPTPVLTALMDDDPLIDPYALKVAGYVSAFRSLIVAQPNGPMTDWDSLVAHAQNNRITIAGTSALLVGAANVFEQAGIDAVYVPYSSTGQATSDFLGGHIDLLAATASTALGVAPDNGVVVLNSSDIALPEAVAEQLGGNIPEAADFGYSGMRFPRPIGFHPDTPDAVVAEFSERLESLLKEDPIVPGLLSRMGEEVIFMGYPEANEDFARLVDRMRSALTLLD